MKAEVPVKFQRNCPNRGKGCGCDLCLMEVGCCGCVRGVNEPLELPEGVNDRWTRESRGNIWLKILGDFGGREISWDQVLVVAIL